MAVREDALVMMMEVTTKRERVAQVTSPNLAESQEDLLRRIAARRAFPVSDASDRMEDVIALIGEGHVRLAAIVYPWGLDFQLEAIGAIWAPFGRGEQGA